MCVCVFFSSFRPHFRSCVMAVPRFLSRELNAGRRAAAPTVAFYSVCSMSFGTCAIDRDHPKSTFDRGGLYTAPY